MAASPSAPARRLSAYSSSGSSSTKMRSASPGSTPTSRLRTTGSDTSVPMTGKLCSRSSCCWWRVVRAWRCQERHAGARQVRWGRGRVCAVV
jgi:hypothetical protein